MLKWMEQLSLGEWILLSFINNSILFGISVLLYIFIDKTCPKPLLQKDYHPITRKDIWLSIFTIFWNSVVMLFGIFLWKKGWLTFTDDFSFKTVLFQVICIVIGMDFLMYVFHRIAHFPIVYNLIHGKHHDHISVNYLSLFILHPVEAVGFGLTAVLVLLVYDFSIYAVAIYFLINLIWGTIGHLNKEFFPDSWEKSGIGTSKFHNNHHLFENKNFGFYTAFWDKLFGTYKR